MYTWTRTGDVIVQPIEAKYISYNANTRNKDVGDCTKRALSLAFGLDYDEVSRELNQIKRGQGQTEYNLDSVWTKFTDRRNVKFIKDNRGINLDEFCQEHPTGTYLILTGRPTRYHSNHIVCVIDGNIYDSWNSGNQKVFEYALVTSTASDGWDPNAVTIGDMADDLCQYIKDYCAQLFNKYYAYLDKLELRSWRIKDDTTGVFRVGVQVLGEDDHKFSSYRSGVIYIHEVIAKINIKLSFEQNLTTLKKKIKQKIYDWLYNIVDDLKAAQTVRTINFSKYADRWMSSSDKRFMTKLPQWSWPYINTLSTDEGRWTGYKYRVIMDRLPDDPNRDRYVDITFFADTLTELKSFMNEYHDTFKEPNY